MAPDPADVQFREGNAAYHQGRFADARAAYVAAFRIKQTHDIAANLGFAEVKLEQWREAAKHLAFALRNWAPTGKVDSKESAAHWLGLAKQQIATLTITVDAGAEVLLDGKPVTTTAGEELFVDPGMHAVGARREGYAPVEQTVQAEKGKAFPVTLTLMLVPEVKAAPTATATATVPVPPGGKGPSTAVLVSGGGLTAVALVMGTAFAVVSNGKASDAAAKNEAFVKAGGPRACSTKAPAAGCGALTDLLKTRATLAQASLGSFVGAGVMAAATVIYGLAAPRSERKAGVRAVPVVSGHGAGLVVDGSF